jgi:DNA mismatch endonuclease (patch repair protein)
MADVFTQKKRSEIMSRIGRKDTAPEIRVRRLLHALGFRFRLHRSDLPGKPDIVLPRHNKIFLVHGCFWHSHEGCPRAALPTTNPEFWRAKIEKNVTRDRRVCDELRDLGWSVLVLWQCELTSIETLTDRLLKFLGGTGRSGARPKQARSKGSATACQ